MDGGLQGATTRPRFRQGYNGQATTSRITITSKSKSKSRSKSKSKSEIHCLPLPVLYRWERSC